MTSNFKLVDDNWNWDVTIVCPCGNTSYWRNCPRHEADDTTNCLSIECPTCLYLETECEEWGGKIPTFTVVESHVTT
jgi:hypothetical protein